MSTRPKPRAVIYARYSSHSQTEQSIEGQLADAHAFADRVGYQVIGEYIDRALTGTKDARPDFQRMIRDAEKHQFQIILVWKLDRFARNRYDSAFYKARLKKYGVRVVSFMEQIPESPEGIILEGLLESMAEYYSANLSENIRRGQQESMRKGWFCGGGVPFGYRVEDHRLVPDPVTAPVVRELFARYAAGEKQAALAADLNARGIRTAKGYAWKLSSFKSLFENPVYVGRYQYAGQEIPGLADALIDEDTFAAAAARREANRRAPAARRSPVVYLLQGKAFCGLCGMPMSGESGTGRNGSMYHYYKCSGRKHRQTGCRKKAEKKDFAEWYVVEQTVAYILDPLRLDHIASAVVDLYNSDNDTARLRELEQAVARLNAQAESIVDNLLTTPKASRSRLIERLDQVENQRLAAEEELTNLRLTQKIPITKAEVSAWLRTFHHGDPMDPNFRQKVIDTFIQSVYFYDDKLVIYFNLTGNAHQTSIIDPLPPEDLPTEDAPVSTLLPCVPLPPPKGEPLAKHPHPQAFLLLTEERIALVIPR